MTKITTNIVILNAVLLLLYFNFAIYKKEQTLANGSKILFELAPVDPRSLMQGDYMALRYAIADKPTMPLKIRRGYCIVTLDLKRVAQYVRLQAEAFPVKKGEYAIKYKSPNDYQMQIGADSYFFQEGKAKQFEDARYGALQIDAQGNSILVGLCDNKGEVIVAE